MCVNVLRRKKTKWIKNKTFKNFPLLTFCVRDGKVNMHVFALYVDAMEQWNDGDILHHFVSSFVLLMTCTTATAKGATKCSFAFRKQFISPAAPKENTTTVYVKYATKRRILLNVWQIRDEKLGLNKEMIVLERNNNCHINSCYIETHPQHREVKRERERDKRSQRMRYVSIANIELAKMG